MQNLVGDIMKDYYLSYRNRRRRYFSKRKMDRRRTIADNKHHKFYPPYYLIDEGLPSEHLHHLQFSRHANSYKHYLKKQASKTYRRLEISLAEHGKQYRKHFDLYWNLY